MITEVKNPIELPRTQMISVNDVLPEPFQDVLVYGICESKDKINFGFYIARRWSGSNQSQKWQQNDYEWLTTSDYIVKLATHWCPVPIFK